MIKACNLYLQIIPPFEKVTPITRKLIQNFSEAETFAQSIHLVPKVTQAKICKKEFLLKDKTKVRDKKSRDGCEMETRKENSS